jgi:hypothetical protein
MLHVIYIIIIGEEDKLRRPHYVFFPNHLPFQPSSVQMFSSAPCSQIHSIYFHVSGVCVTNRTGFWIWWYNLLNLYKTVYNISQIWHTVIFFRLDTPLELFWFPNSSARTQRKPSSLVKIAYLLARYLAIDICERHRKHLLRHWLYCCVHVFRAFPRNGSSYHNIFYH